MDRSRQSLPKNSLAIYRETLNGSRESGDTVSRETPRLAVGFIISVSFHCETFAYLSQVSVMARVVAIANQKGGVGKTTTAVNLAACLAAAEQRILLVDGDPQGNATSGIGLRNGSFESTVYDVILNPQDIRQAIVPGVQFQNLSVLPATPDLAGAEIELVNRENRELVMRQAFEEVRADFDIILVDCPPSLGLITINMLAAADALLIPLQCEYYALEGLSQLLNTVHLVQQGVNPTLVIDGVLLTMFDARLNLSNQVAADARQYFGSKVFNTVIPRNVRLAEAPSFGKPIILYDVASVGAQAYISIAHELIERYNSSSQLTVRSRQKHVSSQEIIAT